MFVTLLRPVFQSFVCFYFFCFFNTIIPWVFNEMHAILPSALEAPMEVEVAGVPKLGGLKKARIEKYIHAK